MDIKIVNAGPINTNCYVVIKNDSCFVIDCGGNEVADFLIKNGIKNVTVFLTHGHYDHIYGLSYLKEKIDNVRIFAHEDEKEVIENPIKNCSVQFGDAYTISGIEYKKDNEVINVLDYDIKLIHTPGHTIGGCCYYIENEKILFAGDTLFYHSSGRTDLPTGNIRTIVNSIGSKLMVLPDDVKVYPGHDISTTILEEKNENEVVKVYQKFMNRR